MNTDFTELSDLNYNDYLDMQWDELVNLKCAVEHNISVQQLETYLLNSDWDVSHEWERKLEHSRDDCLEMNIRYIIEYIHINQKRNQQKGE